MKNLLWSMVLLCATVSTQPVWADTAGKEMLQLSRDLKEAKPDSAAPADPAALYEAGTKAYKQGDVGAAMSALKPAADAGHAPSQAFLGFILDKALFYDDAVVYYRKAVEQGNAEGQYGLGVMYSEGSGVKKDVDEARRLIMAAGSQGHKDAINVMAQAYISGGLGLTEADRQSPDALAWIKRAANNDDLPSIDVLAAAYKTGLYGLTPNSKEAEVLVAKANKLRGVAAAKGDKGKKKSK